MKPTLCRCCGEPMSEPCVNNPNVCAQCAEAVPAHEADETTVSETVTEAGWPLPHQEAA